MIDAKLRMASYLAFGRSLLATCSPEISSMTVVVPSLTRQPSQGCRATNWPSEKIDTVDMMNSLDI